MHSYWLDAYNGTNAVVRWRSYGQDTLFNVHRAEGAKANLFIFTLNGELLETYPVTVFGYGEVSIDGSTLNAGMYLYSLVVDGQIVDTKRMILTK